MPDKEQPILLEKRDRIGYITFNRPEVLNSFRPSDYILFNDLVNDCDQDDDLRAVIVTGNGRAWSVGDDIKIYLDEQVREDYLDGDIGMKNIMNGNLLEVRKANYQVPTQKTCVTMLNSSKVWIAASNGINYIAEYLYAMDFVVAAENSTFAQGDVMAGFCPIGSSSQLAPRVLGRRRATELLLLCDLISADEAYRLGLVNRVVPEEDLMAEAERIAHKIMNYSMSAIQLTKQLMTKAQDIPLSDGLQLEQMFCEQAITSGEMKAYGKRYFDKKKS